MPARALAEKIDRSAVERAASVEEDFRALLQKVGLVKKG